MSARRKIHLCDFANEAFYINMHDRRGGSKDKSVALIGEGIYAPHMLKRLLNQGVNVVTYFSRGKPFGTIYENTGVNVRNFTTARGLRE